MKRYVNPELEVLKIKASDIISTSPGTETSTYDESDVIWELDINH